MSRVADLLAQRQALLEAVHRERAHAFVLKVLAPSKTNTIPIEWLKVTAESMPASFEEGGARVELPRWLPQATLLEVLKAAGFRIRHAVDGRHYVYAKHAVPAAGGTR